MTTQLATFLQDTLGSDYRIEQELDGGGMSRVFLATDLRHNRRVVVKVLTPELASDTSSARFRREIELTIRLQHPHILPILTSGAQDDTLYYITPYIPGESLRARIAREGKLPLADIVKFLRDVSGALAFAHERGVVHRDVKPGNILLAEGHAILADFGIARAVATSATPLTGSGMVPGTPAYMAPELPTDEKADVYALGVVACEMLCGGLPKRGVNAKEIVASRGKLPGDTAARVRELAEVIADAVSVSPDRRVQTARELNQRVDTIGAHARRRSWLSISAAVLVVAVVATAAVWLVTRGHGPSPDRYAVAPMGRDTSGIDAMAGAVAEWRGAEIVDPARVLAAAATSGASRLATRDATALGRALAAGHVIAVEQTRDQDSVIVRAILYDAAGDTLVRSSRAAYPSQARRAERVMAYRRLANAMLRDGAELPWADASDETAPSLTAWREYDEGRRLLRAWELAAAETRFRGAANAQPSVVIAHLWLAQTLLWRGGADRLAEAKSEARRALDGYRGLSGNDSLLAAGVFALASRDYGAACSAMDRLRVVDSMSVAAWIGVADCRAQDALVVPDARSPTGRAYRGSYEAAANAYERASEVGPSFEAPAFQGWILGRLSRVLSSATNVLRVGAGSDSSTFAALPLLDHDTIAFHPVTLAELSAGRHAPPFAATDAAVRRNRILMRRAAEEWARRAPNDPAAFDSLANWSEVAGGIATIGERSMTTLDVIQRALQLATDSTQRIHLAVSKVRLLVKDSRFDAARALAESLLTAGVDRHTPYVAGAAGLAALLGRVDEAARIFGRDPETAKIFVPHGPAVVMPPQLTALASTLLSRAAFGAADDSIAALASTFSDLVTSYVPTRATADDVRTRVIPWALAFAYPAGAAELSGFHGSGGSAIDLLAALARGDSQAARRAMAPQPANLSTKPASTMDMVFLGARLALFVRDTAAAVRELDLSLRALPTLSPRLLTQVPETAALVRALALRAELAARAGDRETASRLATAVVTLWRNADPSLQPMVARLKQLATPAS